MKKYLFLIGLAIASLIYSCGKSGNPAPDKPTPAKPIDNTKPPTDPNTGNGGTDGSGGTGYTTKPTQVINAESALINYNVSLGKVTSTLSTNAGGGGIQTVDGGSTGVELVGVNDGDFTVTNLKDAIDFKFRKTADPIMRYTTKNETDKTITVVDVHFNKSVNASDSDDLIIQGNTVTAFSDNTVTYNAAWAILKAKTSAQVIQKLVFK